MKNKAIQSIAILGSVSTLVTTIGLQTTPADAASIKTNQSKVSIQLQKGQAINSAKVTDTYISTGNGVRIRSGAGTNYGILDSVNKNKKLNVISYSNGWYKLNYNGKTGYISAAYVDKQTNPSTNINENVSGNYVSTGDGVRIRSGAGTTYSILGSVNKKQNLNVISYSKGWYKVKFSGKIGFISETYVDKKEVSKPSTPTTSTPTTSTPTNNGNKLSGNYISNASQVRVRTGAGTTYSIIGKVNKNQKLDVISESNGWHKVNFNGKTGYISSAFVTKVEETVSQSPDLQDIASFAKQFIGVPYKWAGETPAGFDCSGFIYYVYKENGKAISRSNVSGYWYNSLLLQTVSSPQPGDLIFFQNTYTTGPSHIGIMINSTEFVQVGSSTGVTVSNINNTYWKQHFLGYKRFK